MVPTTENMPVISSDIQTAPVRPMAPTAALDAVIQEINAAYSEGRRNVSQEAAKTAWCIGEAAAAIQGQYESVNQLYEALVVYGAKVGSRSNFYRCVNAYKHWPQGLPEGTDMAQVKAVSAGNEAVPTVQEKSEKPKINADNIHAYVLDKVGDTWRRSDAEAIEGFLGRGELKAV